jgi:hypothetical protein
VKNRLQGFSSGCLMEFASACDFCRSGRIASFPETAPDRPAGGDCKRAGDLAP